MKKSYTKPEIEMVEYMAENVIMLSANLDNEGSWLSAWNAASRSGVLGELNK